MLWIVLSLVFGWTIFLYLWLLALRRNDPALVLYLVAVVIAVADVLVAATLIWIGHNKRLARRGSRGRTCAFVIPRYEHDRVARRIVLPPRKELQSAPVLRVTISGDQKIFSPASSVPPAA
ncbi:MAG TPA: hypothetical protein VF057_02635 [Thermoanaerobaculia bacterium]